ncbi:MAG: hypothetical protein AB9M53_00540 [Leptothrix sp. (in: b-proteobacteria)]
MVHRIHAPEPAQIRITGQLLGDAEWRVTSGATVAGFIRLLIDQGNGVPLRVVQAIGTDPTRQMAARAKAHALRRGRTVDAYGRALIAHGDRLIELVGVTDIVLPAPHARHEPAAPATTAD